ncbi:hypothetical protein AB4Y72_18935 [Arthrobacter sp. YAF34]|uniref:hypothetical protein n=1 Tax=Arthrobacter sp. YAF34 TaxID=3233083 RepID=UPI003F933BBD
MNRTESRVEQADNAPAGPFKRADALKAAQTDSSRIDQLMADAAEPEGPAEPEEPEEPAQPGPPAEVDPCVEDVFLR